MRNNLKGYFFLDYFININYNLLRIDDRVILMSKKSLFLILTIILCCFFAHVDVYAAQVEGTDGAGNSGSKGTKSDTALKSNDVTVECIYADGSLIISSSTNGVVSVSRETSPIVSSDESSSNQIAEYYILNKEGVVANGACLNYLVTAQKSVKMWQQECTTDKDGKESCNKVGDPYTALLAYYKTSNDSNTKLTNGEVGNTKPWYQIFTSEQDYANSEMKNSKAYSLVSERIFIENDSVISNLEQANKCYYIKNATQAAGNNSYLTLYMFNNVTLVDNNGMMTALTDLNKNIKVLDSCPGDTLYFNDPSRKVDISKSSPKYSYDYARFGYSAKEEAGYNKKFEVTSPPNFDELSGKNACEDIPETIVVLKQIIGILQIGVPAFVIILTGIDIFKIAMAGNLDDELPKRKKVILIRLIIMLLFFFLPLFINLGLKLLFDNSDWFRKEVGIKDINCLFE